MSFVSAQEDGHKHPTRATFTGDATFENHCDISMLFKLLAELLWFYVPPFLNVNIARALPASSNAKTVAMSARQSQELHFRSLR